MIAADALRPRALTDTEPEPHGPDHLAAQRYRLLPTVEAAPDEGGWLLYWHGWPIGGRVPTRDAVLNAWDIDGYPIADHLSWIAEHRRAA